MAPFVARMKSMKTFIAIALLLAASPALGETKALPLNADVDMPMHKDPVLSKQTVLTTWDAAQLPLWEQALA